MCLTNLKNLGKSASPEKSISPRLVQAKDRIRFHEFARMLKINSANIEIIIKEHLEFKKSHSTSVVIMRVSEDKRKQDKEKRNKERLNFISLRLGFTSQTQEAEKTHGKSLLG